MLAMQSLNMHDPDNEVKLKKKFQESLIYTKSKFLKSQDVLVQVIIHTLT